MSGHFVGLALKGLIIFLISCSDIGNKEQVELWGVLTLFLYVFHWDDFLNDELYVSDFNVIC